MTSERAARLLRSHGVHAWPTDDRDVVLTVDVTVEPTLHGPILRVRPVLIGTSRLEVMEWLGC